MIDEASYRIRELRPAVFWLSPVYFGGETQAGNFSAARSGFGLKVWPARKAGNRVWGMRANPMHGTKLATSGLTAGGAGMDTSSKDGAG
ncbi:MAG TPA: hypothetical protein VMA34_00470 [Terracidiphilus sp.]|nr:hypothetical protein [Terracidiphilus sp.]